MLVLFNKYHVRKNGNNITNILYIFAQLTQKLHWSAVVFHQCQILCGLHAWVTFWTLILCIAAIEFSLSRMVFTIKIIIMVVAIYTEYIDIFHHFMWTKIAFFQHYCVFGLKINESYKNFMYNSVD